MSTSLEQVQDYLHTALIASLPEVHHLSRDAITELRISINDLTQDWEISIARDRKAKWRVYLPREPKP